MSHATTTRPASRAELDAGKIDAEWLRLMADLRSTVAGEVRFDAGSRALYATDSSNYRQVAIGVVIPRTTEDVIATVATCHRYQVPILSRGGGSALLAAGIAVGGAAIGAFARQRSML